MLVDVGKGPIGSLLGLHGLHRTSSDQRPAPGPRRIIDFVHDALADGRRLRILRVISISGVVTVRCWRAQPGPLVLVASARLWITAFRSGSTRNSWHASCTRSVSAFQRSRAVRHTARRRRPFGDAHLDCVQYARAMGRWKDRMIREQDQGRQTGQLPTARLRISTYIDDTNRYLPRLVFR